MILKIGDVIRFKSNDHPALFLVLDNFESKVQTVCIWHHNAAGIGVIGVTPASFKFESLYWEIL
jgi:hypothetical protein